MKFTKLEKIMLLGCPWFFGTVLIITQILGAKTCTNRLYSLVSVAAGLILISIYCVCALLAKIIEK